MRRWFRRSSAIRYFLSPIAALATMLIISGNAAAGTPATTYEVPIDSAVLNPCTGHLVSISGTQRLIQRTVVEDGVEHLVITSIDAGIKGVDAVTGETYVWNHHLVDVLYWNLGVPTMQTAEATGVLVGAGAGFRLKSLLHYTVNANGALTASFDGFEITCM